MIFIKSKNSGKRQISATPLEERLAALRKEIAEILPPKAGGVVTTLEFDAFKERLRTLQSTAAP
jgi:hypothetical protein